MILAPGPYVADIEGWDLAMNAALPLFSHPNLFQELLVGGGGTLASFLRTRVADSVGTWAAKASLLSRVLNQLPAPPCRTLPPTTSARQ